MSAKYRTYLTISTNSNKLMQHKSKVNVNRDELFFNFNFLKMNNISASNTEHYFNIFTKNKLIQNKIKININKGELLYIIKKLPVQTKPTHQVNEI